LPQHRAHGNCYHTITMRIRINTNIQVGSFLSLHFTDGET